MTITYTRTEPGEGPPGRLAEAVLKFEHGSYGVLEGVGITGIGVWTPSEPHGEPRVTLPGRVYEVDGRRERYDLLVPGDAGRSTEPLRAAIRQGWTALGEQSGVVTLPSGNEGGAGTDAKGRNGNRIR